MDGEDVVKIGGAVFICLLIGGYFYGRATSPDFATQEGQLAFRNFVADQAKSRLFRSRTQRSESQAGLGFFLGALPDSQLYYDCGTTRFVFNQTLNDVAPTEPTPATNSTISNVPSGRVDVNEGMKYI